MMFFMKNELMVIFVQKEEGISLVSEAICSGTFNDLGSGSNVDICVQQRYIDYSLNFVGEFFFLYVFLFHYYFFGSQ